MRVLGPALALLADLPIGSAVVGVLPITGAQWRRSVVDAAIDDAVARFAAKRATVASLLTVQGSAVGRELRPAALDLAKGAADLAGRLELLAALDAGDRASSVKVSAWSAAVVQDARQLLQDACAARAGSDMPGWPTMPQGGDEDRDVLLAVFGVSSTQVVDDTGAFSDARVIAEYRLRLNELQIRCDRVLALVTDHPPSVFTAVSSTRDLATSVSPWLSLRTAREVRVRLLDAFDADENRAADVLAAAAREADKEAAAFTRLTDCVRRASEARTERERSFALVEAYKHMAEGHTRRWVSVLLELAGLDESLPTLGQLAEPAAARLGDLGTRVAAALLPTVRNAEAHEDFDYDDDRGELIIDGVAFSSTEILSSLTELDVLQRGWIAGRLAAFADRPKLGDALDVRSAGASRSAAMAFSKLRFGHAGQRMRSFVRDGQRVEVEIEGLRAHACNPCLMALTQSAQVLPNVDRFIVRVTGRSEPVIDLPSGVLHANFVLLLQAIESFPDQLPQVTFLPCLAHARLAVERLSDAATAAAWIALNDAQHAVLDAEASPQEAVRLRARLNLVGTAADITARSLPQGTYLAPLERAARVAHTTEQALKSGGRGVADEAIIDRILRLRDRLGPPPAVLPTLDPAPPEIGGWPHEVS